jgi:RHS repeat-associated protein
MPIKVNHHTVQGRFWAAVVAIIFFLPVVVNAVTAEPEKAEIRFAGSIKSDGYYGLYFGELYVEDYGSCDGIPLPESATAEVIVGEPIELSIYSDGCNIASDIKILGCNRIFVKKLIGISPAVEWESRSISKSKCGFSKPGEEALVPLPIYLTKKYCVAGSSRIKAEYTVDEVGNCDFEQTDEGCDEQCLPGFLNPDDGKRYAKKISTTTFNFVQTGSCDGPGPDARVVNFTCDYNSVQTDEIGCAESDNKTTYSGFAAQHSEITYCPTGESYTVDVDWTQQADGTWISEGEPGTPCSNGTPTTTYAYENVLPDPEDEYTNPYSTSDLKTKTLAALPAYDDDWDDTAGSYFNLTTGEQTNSIRESRYRLRYTPPSPDADAPTTLKWVERFIPENGVPITSVEVADGGYGYTSAPTVTISAPNGTGTTAQAVATVAGGVVTQITLTNPGSGYKLGSYSAYVSGGGGSGAVLLLHFGTETPKSAGITPASGPSDTSHVIGPFTLAIPSENGTTLVDNVHIPATKWRRLDQAAEYQLQTKGGNWLLMAMPAGGTSGAGEPSANLGSVDFKLDLGPSPDGYSYGKLQLYAAAINTAASLRAQWILSTTSISAAEVEQISDGGGLRQIISPAGLIDLQNVSGGCDIRFYTSSDYNPLNSGLYPIKSGAVPYVTYEVRDATASSVAKVLIKEIRPSATGKYHLYGQQSGEVWSLEQGTLGSGSTLVPTSRTTRSPLTLSGQPAYQFIEEDYTYSPGPRTTTRRTFTKDAVAPYASRDQSIDYPEGRRVIYDYTKGYFNSYSGDFTADEWGSDLLTTETAGRAFVSPELWAGHSTRTATVTNSSGATLQRTLAVYNGSGFADVEQTRYGYDGQGNLVSQTRNGQTTYSAQWTDGFKDWEIDETGVKTTYTPWPEGTYVTASGKQPVMTKVKAAVGSYGSYPAQSAITTTYYYSPDGNGDVYVSAEEKSGGGLTQSSAFTQDSEGRPTHTESNSLHTSYAYETLSGGGLRTTTTQPSGATEVREEDADGRTLRVSGTGVTAEYHTYTQDVNGNDVHTTFYGSSTAATANYLTVVTDGNGRRLRELRPSFLTATTAGVSERNFYYAVTGQLVKETATGMADMLYVYNDLGELWRSGYDMNGDGQLTLASTDKLQQTEATYQQDGGDWYRVSSVQIPYALNSSTLTTVSQTKERLTLPAGTLSETISIDEAGVQTRTVSTVNLSQALVEEVTTVSGVTGTSLRATRNGLLQAEQTNAQTAPMLYAYDGLGRLSTITPAAGPVTVYGYNADGLPESTTRHSPDNTQTWVESLTYHAQGTPGAGQVASRTTAGQATYYSYDVRGHVLRQWGASYPVRFTYDAFGRMETLHTYRTVGFDLTTASWPAGDTTTWAYHAATGQLISKTDAAGQPVSYTYWPSGALKTRTLARGLVATYGYTDARELASISYSDDTPDVGITYDRAGRPLATTDAAGTLTRSYESGVVKDELYTGTGLLAGRSITRGLGSYGRLSSLTTDAGYALGYTYDGAGRLDELTQGTHLAKYGYKANVGSVETVTIKRQGVERVLNEYAVDGLDRLETVKTTTGALVPVQRDYRYNTANQRDRITHEDTRLWSYGYDGLGQVNAAQKRLADNVTPLPGYSFGYDFDQIGNRSTTTVNGRTATYTPNQLNQIETRQVPGAVDVKGEALAGATVTVDAQSTTRTGKDYYKEVALANSTTAAKARLSIAATDGTQTVTETRLAFLQQTPEAFEYDLDGNLKKDGRWDYTWDAENRLVKMETRSTVASASGIARERLTFAYDSQGRRIRKLVELFNPTTSSWVQTADTKFIYDGWNLLAEHRWNPTTSTYVLNVSYVWGLDLSGTLQGAGGVGGLLWANLDTQTFVASADANGNVVAYVNTDTQAVAGRLDYGAFGEPVVKTGVAGVIPYGFSSKYTDMETGLLYYGYRYYDTVTGRWLSTDPIEEAGGWNLYANCRNDAANYFDYLGLWAKPDRKPHERRASVLAQKGDTWKALAMSLRLNESEARIWVKNYDDVPCPGKKYQVPNTAYIDVSTYTFGVLGLWLMEQERSIEASWRSEDLFIEYNYGDSQVTASSIITNLRSKDIYKYLYIGHGGAGMLGKVPDDRTSRIQRSTGTDGFIAAQRYTPYGIAEMYLIACATGKDASRWRLNVSQLGVVLVINAERFGAWSVPFSSTQSAYNGP